MPTLTDPGHIRSLLNRDRVWSLFALGDLAPDLFVKARWFTPDLTLVLHLHDTSILFAMGTASVREALDHVTSPARLQVQTDALDEVSRYAAISSAKLMWRMGWNGAALPPPGRSVTRLGAGDLDRLQTLYSDGDATGETPDFFFPSMLTDGVFFGIEEKGALVAAAGTHLVWRDEGVAAIGNIYTRRDRRRRGLGRDVTNAVVTALTGIQTIGLSVRADNHAAIRAYEALGFVRHCQFYEAIATRVIG